MIQIPMMALVRAELVATLRRVAAIMLLALLVLAGTLVIWAAWPEGTNINRVGSVSREIFAFVLGILFFGSAVFVPALTAGAIVVEKERGTYEMLSLTLIRPSGILMGKLLNTVGFVVLLMVACMPLFGVSFFLVGLDWVEVGVSFGLMLLAIVTIAMLGMLASTLFRKTYVAIIFAYLGMLTVMVGPLLIPALYYSIGRVWFINRSFIEAAMMISPVFMFANVLESSNVFLNDLAPSLIFQTIIIGVCWIWTLFLLRRPPKPVKVKEGKPIADPVVLEQRRKTFPFYLIDPMRQKELIEDGRNPMLVKEVRWGMMSRGSVLIRVFYIALFVYFFVGVAVVVLDWYQDVIFRYLMAQILLTAVIAPALMANAFTKEYELGNLDLLRSSLLRAHEVVLGKLMAGVISIAPLVLAAICSSAPFLVLERGGWRLLVTGYSTLVLCAFLSLTIGLAASAATKASRNAVALSYLLAIMLFVGMSALIGGAFSWMSYKRWIQWIPEVETLAFFSPIFAFAQHTDRYGDTEISLYWVSNVAFFTAIGVLLVVAACVCFALFRMREK